MKTRKIPMRMCVGCREMREKKDLVRIVRSQEGEIHVDLTGRANGRGAYIDRNAECLEKAIKTRQLERTFSTKIEPAVYDQLREEINGTD